MTLQIRMVVTWIFPECTWPEEETSPVANFPMNIPEVWRPPITHINSAVGSQIYNENEDPVEIAKNFYNHSEIMGVLSKIMFVSTSCRSFSFKNFPFDKLSCNFIFDVELNVTYLDFNEIVIALDNSIKDIVDPADVWEFVEFHSSTKNVPILNDFSGHKKRIYFTAIFNRKCLYYIINIMLPVWMLFVLQMSILILSPYQTERPSYSLTVVLAYAVSLTFVLEKIPQTTEIVYLIVLIDLHIVFSVVMTIYLFFISYLAFVKKVKYLRTFDVIFGILTFGLVLLKDFFLLLSMIYDI